MESYNLGKCLSVNCMFCIQFIFLIASNSINDVGTAVKLLEAKLNLDNCFIALTQTNSSVIKRSNFLFLSQATFHLKS